MIAPQIYHDTPEHYHEYFDLITTGDLMAELRKSKSRTLDLLQQIPPEKEDFAYRPGKWTIKEVLWHLIDVERIFAYRALRFSRFDPTPLPGMDENKYIENLKPVKRTLSDLTREYESVRNATISLFHTMSATMLDFKGTANDQFFTARALGFMIVGHNLHHVNFIQWVYLEEMP